MPNKMGAIVAPMSSNALPPVQMPPERGSRICFMAGAEVLASYPQTVHRRGIARHGNILSLRH